MTKRMKTIKVLSFLLLIVAVLFSCKEDRRLRYEAFQTAKGWGYNIRLKDRILIHQESVPAQASDNGFATKSQAEATARLVIKKMRNKEMPSLTKEETDDINEE